ncbi:MAG: hypothetical protein JJ959_13920 [Nisaea sp.]|uniref:hypothetical protein n=1 Tax=Nisaea sp. TaxID=2024842 RepID=UPI001B1EA0D8|nr:hypothetical protein [Nisaea sp.]MBO6561636.1 hypothetical protein [Nisaea sp.]
MRWYVLPAILLGACGFLIGIFAADAHPHSRLCPSPKNGEAAKGGRDDSGYHFEFISFFTKDPHGDYEFGRCVYNKHSRPLWVEWTKTGLKGVAKTKDRAYKRFSATDNQWARSDTILYHGVAPENMDVEAVLRPSEVTFSNPQWGFPTFASMSDQINLESALVSRSAFERALDQLRRNTQDKNALFRHLSAARIALPQNSKVFETLRGGGGKNTEINNQFFSVDITASQYLQFDGEKIRPISIFSIRVDETDLEIFSGSDTVEVDFLGTDPEFFKIFPSLNEYMKLHEPNFTVKEFSESVPFPARRQTVNVVLNFSGYGSVEMPVTTIQE